VIALIAALAAGVGVWLLVGPPPQRTTTAERAGWDERTLRWLRQAGLVDVGLVEFATVCAAVATVAGTLAWLVFAGVPAAFVTAVFALTLPVAGYRNRRRRRRESARDAWPRVLEQIRLNATSLGMSLPRAVFEAGRSAPPGLAEPFATAERIWRMSGDLERALDVLKHEVGDATTDAVAETLLVAHEAGGTDLSPRLLALIEDRDADVRARRDARAQQAGARFARAFVLVVPAGMALVGLTIGEGRDAYATTGGQATVVAAIAALALCWIWSGRILRLPEDERVFGS
jgi:tight adherence protein B